MGGKALRKNLQQTDQGVTAVEEIRRQWRPAAFGLIWMVFASVSLVRTHGSPAWTVIGLAIFVVIGACYVLLPPALMFLPLWRRLTLLAGLLLLTAGLWPVEGSSLVGIWTYIGIIGGAILSLRQTATVVLILAVAMLLLSDVDHRPLPWYYMALTVGLSLWISVFVGNLKLARQLDQIRALLAKTAVAAERERFGRDLHDILGHSLTAIVVKAGLARTLVERGADGAAQEIADVEQLARDALVDVWATASGYRQVRLGPEIAVAAMVLKAAGIELSAPIDIDHVDPTALELFGYVVRESVTNVVRHSRARTCDITVGLDWVQIVDNGVGVGVADPIISGFGL